MPPTDTIALDGGRRLAPVVLELIRELRAVREAYHVAVGIIAERDARLERLRAENRHVRTQLRAVLSGRTIADERLALDEDARDAA